MARDNSDWWFRAQIIAICALWYGSSASQNVINKLALQSYPYPLTIALSSLLNNVFYAVPLTRLLHIKPVQLSSSYLLKAIFPISVGRAFAVVTAYFGLMKLAVSFAQIIKGTMPIFTIVISRLILGERQTGRVYMSLLPIIGGVFIASLTELQFNTFGLISALLSTGTFAFLNVLAKKVFEEINLHPITLLSINSQMAAVILFPLWALRDGRDMWLDYAKHDEELANNPAISTFLLFLFLTGFLSFVQNLCAFCLIHQLTALSYSVSNAAKRVSVILISLMTLHNPVAPLNFIGMLISVTGIFVYNRVKYIEGRKRPKSPIALNEHPNQLLRRRERTISLTTSNSDVRLLLSGN